MGHICRLNREIMFQCSSTVVDTWSTRTGESTTGKQKIQPQLQQVQRFIPSYYFSLTNLRKIFHRSLQRRRKVDIRARLTTANAPPLPTLGSFVPLVMTARYLLISHQSAVRITVHFGSVGCMTQIKFGMRGPGAMGHGTAHMLIFTHYL